ncbi:hypothetical protein C414_000430027 [Campylobacter jejuni subsp. jejuni 414]|nr:hypothetical protein C414_000430027 [Campylobacter jejuni subsp. jejuni 414]
MILQLLKAKYFSSNSSLILMLLISFISTFKAKDKNFIFSFYKSNNPS